MQVTLWGTRGSLPTPGPETVRYGGNTACVSVELPTVSSIVVLDAGTGIARLGASLPAEVDRVDLLLTHLHMDHIQGLGFFKALFREDLEVHIWGPGSPRAGLHARLSRYLSPPLFPVRIPDLPCRLTLHDVPFGRFEVPGATVTAATVCHPGATVGYRVQTGSGALAYIPDHEPALGVREFPGDADWTSGHALALGADTLIHDAQYEPEEYQPRVGWGHSTLAHAIALARFAGVRRLVPFHHDPYHDDDQLDRMFDNAEVRGLELLPAREGVTLEV